jgi:hypothetical protein
MCDRFSGVEADCDVQPFPAALRGQESQLELLANARSPGP